MKKLTEQDKQLIFDCGRERRRLRDEIRKFKRELDELSVPKLASKFEVSQGTIRQVECGRR